jgi:hypothetical protein
MYNRILKSNGKCKADTASVETPSFYCVAVRLNCSTPDWTFLIMWLQIWFNVFLSREQIVLFKANLYIHIGCYSRDVAESKAKKIEWMASKLLLPIHATIYPYS